MSDQPDSERLVARVNLKHPGDFVYVDAPFGRVRVQIDDDTLVAVIETISGNHVVSTFAEASEIERANQGA